MVEVGAPRETAVEGWVAALGHVATLPLYYVLASQCYVPRRVAPPACVLEQPLCPRLWLWRTAQAI